MASTNRAVDFKCGFCSREVSATATTIDKALVRRPHQPDSLECLVKCPKCKAHSLIHVNQSGTKITHQSPEPKVAEAPDHVPERVSKFWLKAKQAVLDKDFVTADPVASKVFEVMLQDMEATNGLSSKGGYAKRLKEIFKNESVHPSLEQWLTELRFIRNESTHGDTDPTEEEITDAIDFLEVVMIYHYTLPTRMAISQARRENQ